MEINKNITSAVLRRAKEKPDCFGKIKDESKDKPGKLKCGLCVFNAYCKTGKMPVAKETKKVEAK